MSRRQPYEQKKPMDGAPIFWRSLEEKANAEAAELRAAAEFPNGELENSVVTRGAQHKSTSRIANDPEDMTPIGRRGFMMLGGMVAALAAEGCARRPVEKIMPYVKQPEYAIPGLSYHFATARAHRGDALGLIVESHEGRPTKIEGNPEHPGSLGATDALTQAWVWDLYDPDRSRGVRRRGAESSWAELDKWLKETAATYAKDTGGKLRLLVQPSQSPTFTRLRDLMRDKMPHARIHTYTPVNETNAREGARIAFGQAVGTMVDYANARVILSLDSDFLLTEPGSIRATRSFARGRHVRTPNDTMNRLYVVEPDMTVTGSNADHRLRLPASHIQQYLYALVRELTTKHHLDLGDIGKAAAGDNAGIPEKWISAVAAELVRHRERCAIVIGSRQPRHLHALVHALNGALGNAGKTIQYYPIADAGEGDQIADIKALAKDMSDGKVETLVILGGNPVYDAPADLKFGDALTKVKEVFHLSSHVDETSQKATWHAPRTHELETWGDVKALDGTLSIQQPLIQPLHGARSDIEILATLLGEPETTPHALVQTTFKTGLTGMASIEKEWQKALQKGLVAGAVPRPWGAMSSRTAEVAAAMGQAKKPGVVSATNLEVTFSPCPKLFDGRHGNNPWLLELPNHLTKVVWDNLAHVSEATAKALGVESGDILRLTREGAGSVDIPVWILPGQADNTIGLQLGWGRIHAGRFGNRHGFDVYPLRTSDNMGFADGVKVQKVTGDADAIAKLKERMGEMGQSDHASPPLAGVAPYSQFEADSNRFKVVQTQEHHKMEGRPIAIDATYEEYRKTPTFPQFRSPDPKVLPLWERRDYSKGYRWGMAIDLNACTGCNACVIACQSENNIATVGKEQVMRGREMHWLRVDRYFVGKDEADPQVAMQPVMCVQCEEAPCENVCPVNATAHSPEGLNDMAYNRCVGTRYCANNCPYKVRRFNYLEYQGEPFYGDLPDTVKMQFNPNVTVRMRGVMEKCTYCVQRIQEAKMAARRDGRTVHEGDVVTACQQVCPANAIVFGDLNDPTSRVAELHRRDRAYRLLSEIGTHPRTTHLGKIRNPNPEMA
jgi:molybdopterin-containing oxidoreductase family iron-sulfur binding subunit